KRVAIIRQHRNFFQVIVTAGLITLAAAVPARAGTDDYILGPYLVADVATGAVYANRDALRPWHPASTTKLMTAYVTFRALRNGEIDTDSPVVVSQNALNQPPSKMGFPVGSVLTVDNALKIILVKSANDIAVALAETVAGSEPAFVARMNREANRLGMTRTKFKNPHGLPDPGQITTARDLALLASAILKEFPERRPLFKIHAIRHGKRTLRNYNILVDRYRGTTGMKTGYIRDSGFNLVASARRNDKEVVAVVLGACSAMSRAEKAASLLDAGFRARGALSVRRISLKNVSSGGAYVAVTKMPRENCPKPAKKKGKKAKGPTYKTLPNGVIVIAEGGKTRSSRLNRRLNLGPPVAVYLGGAKAPDGSMLGPTLASLPRPRPADAAQAARASNVIDAGKAPTMAAAFAAEASMPGPPVADLVSNGTAGSGFAVPRPRPNPDR
ncbi:MAG TPA: D-alanyl-D-alanine carboxypeptidase family protein, partial [Afifellaceae bacterium]|nr:D-alanyl-D-alanine carboxypeptidase family protein [Afifellaceae bacterium]